MDNTKKGVHWLISFIIFFAALGYIYEFSYFYELNVKVADVLNFRHYLMSGFYHIGIPLIFISAINQLIKFFSKDISRSEWDVIEERIKNEDINSVIWFARGGLILAVIFWLLTKYENHFFMQPTIFSAYLYILMWVSGLFLLPMLKASKSALSSIIFCFLVSLGLVFSAAGIGYSRTDLLRINTENIIRDDAIVLIKKLDDGTYQCVAKDIKFPRFLEKVLENF